MTPNDQQRRAETPKNALQDELYALAPDVAPILLTRDEMKAVLERMKATVASVAMLLNMDRKTLKTRLDMHLVPLKISEDIKNALGADIFDEALTEIRSRRIVDLGNGQSQVLSDSEGAPKGVHYMTGMQMYKIMQAESINHTGLARIIGKSPTTVSRGIYMRYLLSPVPLTIARKLRDYVGHDRFDQLLALIRNGQFDRYFSPKRMPYEQTDLTSAPIGAGEGKRSHKNWKRRR